MSKNRIGARAKKKRLQWEEICGSVERFNSALINAANNPDIEQFSVAPSVFIVEEHFDDLRKLGKCKLTR